MNIPPKAPANIINIGFFLMKEKGIISIINKIIAFKSICKGNDHSGLLYTTAWNKSLNPMEVKSAQDAGLNPVKI